MEVRMSGLIEAFLFLREPVSLVNSYPVNVLVLGSLRGCEDDVETNLGPGSLDVPAVWGRRAGVLSLEVLDERRLHAEHGVAVEVVAALDEDVGHQGVPALCGYQEV